MLFSMIEMAVLGLLKEQDLHGYELKRRLGHTLGVWSAVSFGSLYPALARLERSGSVKAVGAGPEPRIPMTGSLGGERAAFRSPGRVGRGSRGKKVYSITAEGERLFDEMLAGTGTPEDVRGFNLRLAFARHLPPEARLRLLERRRAELLQRLDRSRESVVEDMDTYNRALVNHSEEATERDIAWLDQLIAGELQPASKRGRRSAKAESFSKGES